jgi:hypothetical protein
MKCRTWVGWLTRHVQKPILADLKLIELAIVTFTTEITTTFGFSIIRHANALAFDYDYIFAAEKKVFSYGEKPPLSYGFFDRVD